MAYDKVIDSAVLDADLTAVANAIRTKGGTTDPLAFPDGFVSAVEGIQAGGGEVDPYADVYRSIIDRTCVNLVMPSDYTEVKGYVFYNMTSLKTFDFSNITKIDWNAFNGSGIESVHIPKPLSYTGIGGSSFANCKSLVTVSMPECTVVHGTYSKVFQNCTALKNINMPKMGGLSTQFFQGCTALEEITLPSLDSSATGLFSGCTMLKTVNVPLLTNVGTSAFENCTSLEFLDLPSVTSINATAFQKSSKFATLVLRNETLVSLANVNAFANTPFASNGTGGTVYVPSALIESYKTATNWSTLYAAGTCNFVAIEGSEYE